VWDTVQASVREAVAYLLDGYRRSFGRGWSTSSEQSGPMTTDADQPMVDVLRRARAVEARRRAQQPHVELSRASRRTVNQALNAYFERRKAAAQRRSREAEFR
jgi:hypothetical protein